MKCQLELNVGISPGEDIEAACEAAQALADRLGVVVRFQFNGVQCLCQPGGGYMALAAAWDREIRKPASSLPKIAANHAPRR